LLDLAGELPGRAQADRAAASILAEQNLWIKNVVWRLAANLQLVADLDLMVADKSISLPLVYPISFWIPYRSGAAL